MRKTALLTLVLLVSLPALAFGQPSTFTVAPNIRFNGLDGVDPRIDLGYQRPLNDQWGIACLAAVFGASQSAAAYCGPTYQAIERERMGLSLGLYAGIETHEDVWRLAASLDFRYRFFALSGLAEYGASGLWHHLRLTFDTGFCLIGLASQRWDGEGLYLEMQAGPGYLFAMGLYSIESRVRFGPSERSIDYISQITGYRLSF